MQQDNQAAQNTPEETANNAQNNANINNAQSDANVLQPSQRSRLPLVLLGSTATVGWASLALAITPHTLSPSLIAATTAITGVQVAAAGALVYGTYKCAGLAIRGTRAATGYAYTGATTIASNAYTSATTIANNSLEAISNKKSALKDFIISKKRPRDEASDQEIPDAKKRATTENINEEELVLDPPREAEQINAATLNEQRPQSDRDIYQANSEILMQEINALEDRLKENQCIRVKNKLLNLSKNVPDAMFSDNGNLREDAQPPRNKVQCLRWTCKNLNKLINMDDKKTRKKFKDTLEKKLKTKINTKPKKMGPI